VLVTRPRSLISRCCPLDSRDRFLRDRGHGVRALQPDGRPRVRAAGPAGRDAELLLARRGGRVGAGPPEHAARRWRRQDRQPPAARAGAGTLDLPAHRDDLGFALRGSDQQEYDYSFAGTATSNDTYPTFEAGCAQLVENAIPAMPKKWTESGGIEALRDSRK
jgi:hypothetical protein